MEPSSNIFLYFSNKHKNRLFALKDVIESKTNSKCYFFNSLTKLEKDLELYFIPDVIIFSATALDSAYRTIIEYINNQPILSSCKSMAITDQDDFATQKVLLNDGLSDYLEYESPDGVVIARITSLLRQKHLLDRLENLAKNKRLVTKGIKDELKSMITTFTASLEYVEKQSKVGNALNYVEIQSTLIQRLKVWDRLMNQLKKFIVDNEIPTKLVKTDIPKIVNSTQYFDTIQKGSFTKVMTYEDLFIFILNEIFNFLNSIIGISVCEIFQCLSSQPYSTNEIPYITTCFNFECHDPEKVKEYFEPSIEYSNSIDSKCLTAPFIKGLIEMMNGNIWITNNAKQKTTCLHIDLREDTEDLDA